MIGNPDHASSRERPPLACASCVFFERDGVGETWGDCRRRSPPFPQVMLRDWCGDHATAHSMPSPTAQRLQWTEEQLAAPITKPDLHVYASLRVQFLKDRTV